MSSSLTQPDRMKLPRSSGKIDGQETVASSTNVHAKPQPLGVQPSRYCGILDDDKQYITKMYGKSQTFPEKMMEILSREEEAGNNTISWLPDGKSFMISNPLKFTLEILPKFFKQTEFSSFTRKLYWWGFKKSSKAHECDSFHHELFCRDDPYLCSKMKGRTTGSKQCKKAIKGKPKKAIASKTICSSLPLSTPCETPRLDVSLETLLSTAFSAASNNVLCQRRTQLMPLTIEGLDPMARIRLMQGMPQQSNPACTTPTMLQSTLTQMLRGPLQPSAMTTPRTNLLNPHRQSSTGGYPQQSTPQSPIVVHVHHHHVGGETFTSVSSSPSPEQKFDDAL